MESAAPPNEVWCCFVCVTDKGESSSGAQPLMQRTFKGTVGGILKYRIKQNESSSVISYVTPRRVWW